MSLEAHTADLIRGGDLLTVLLHDSQTDPRPPHQMIADILGMHPDAIGDLIEMIASRTAHEAPQPTLIAVQVGMAFGARMARANADNARLA